MGIFKKQQKYQGGGDEFIERFWTVEAESLGFSNEDIDNCNKSIEIYDAILKTMESAK